MTVENGHMAYITTSVEYGIHRLLWLVGDNQRALSSRELAELQGISPAFWPRFSQAGKGGDRRRQRRVRGGYRLARPADEISFLAIIDAIEGQCRCSIAEVRGRCAVFDDSPPDWAVLR